MFWLLVFIRSGGSYGRRPVGFVVLGLGLVLLVLGGIVIAGHQDPTCGGEVMAPGQLCRRDASADPNAPGAGIRSPSDRTYEQVRHDQQFDQRVVGPLLAVAGALVAAVGVLWTIRPTKEPTPEPPVLPSAPMWTPYAAQVAATAQAARSAPTPRPGIHHDA